MLKCRHDIQHQHWRLPSSLLSGGPPISVLMLTNLATPVSPATLTVWGTALNQKRHNETPWVLGPAYPCRFPSCAAAADAAVCTAILMWA